MQNKDVLTTEGSNLTMYDANPRHTIINIIDMNKNIIVIKGPKNSGKSTTVRMILQQLRPYTEEQNDSSYPWPKYDFVSSKEPIKRAREVLHKIRINDKVIGLTSFGDNVKIIREKFDTLEGKWNCNYIVCCCRDKGKTFQYINNSYGDRVLEWHSLQDETDFNKRKQNEIKVAYKVDEKILELCGKGNCRFFNPHVGEQYQFGVWGKKVLVLGASFYCDKKYDICTDCTNVNSKDSSKYNKICPECKKDNSGRRTLSEEPSYVDDHYHAYRTFEILFKEATGLKSMWKHILFTNYVQFFVPPYETKSSYLSKRDLDAFHKTLIQYNPDVIICWGVVIVKPIRENYPFVTDREKLPETEHYIWHINPCGKKITMVNTFHPTSRCWNCHYDNAVKYIRMALEEGMEKIQEDYI